MTGDDGDAMKMRRTTHNGVVGIKRSARLLRQVVVASVLCLAIYCLMLGRPRSLLDPSTRPYMMISEDDGGAGRRPLPPELLDNRSLTEKQCRAHFPGLFKEIDDAVAKGPFKFRARNQTGHLGPLVARIKDGKLSILSYQRKVDLSRDMLQHRSATLHQIANALLTWPRSASPGGSKTDIPDTIVAFNHHDDPLPGTWSYSRPADPALLDAAPAPYFPIPHFGFYSWPVPTITSLPDAGRRIGAVEASFPGGKWSEDKIPRAVWRGTAWFNNARAGRARQNLLHATRGKGWADVEALSSPPSSSSSSSPKSGSAGSSSGYSNALRISDFCRYKYIIYTEGITYSGRLPFHQLCRSVLLTPPVAWLQHTTHLIRPVFSHALPGVERTPVPTSGTATTSSEHNRDKSRREVLDDDDGDYDDTHSGGHNDCYNSTTAEHYGDESTTVTKRDQPQQLPPYPAPWVLKTWPHSYPPEAANAVFVAPDWSDLEATVAWLEAHPAVAEGIASRQRGLFADDGGGYFSAAAEMCYWRGLIRGWAGVARTEGLGWDDDGNERDGDGYAAEGVPWEEFSLSEIHK